MIGRILFKSENAKKEFKIRISLSRGIATSLLNFSAVALFRYINNSLFTRGVFDQVKSREIVFENSTDKNFDWASKRNGETILNCLWEAPRINRASTECMRKRFAWFGSPESIPMAVFGLTPSDLPWRFASPIGQSTVVFNYFPLLGVYCGTP